jgi:hypothetical protein
MSENYGSFTVSSFRCFGLVAWHIKWACDHFPTKSKTASSYRGVGSNRTASEIVRSARTTYEMTMHGESSG